MGGSPGSADRTSPATGKEPFVNADTPIWFRMTHNLLHHV